MIGEYLNKSGEYGTTGPCYRVINTIKKTKYRDSDYFTRTRLIGPINTEIFNILYNIHFLDNLIYSSTGIEFSGLHTLSPFSKKLQIIYTRKNDRTITRDFIIQRKRILNHINITLLLKQSKNVNINVLKSSPATNFNILNVIEIGTQTPLIIRTKYNIYSIINKILTHQLLTNPVIHITKPSQVISLIYLSKIIIIHIEFEIHNIPNINIFPIRIFNLILSPPAEHSINNYIILNFLYVQKLRGDDINIIINFILII